MNPGSCKRINIYMMELWLFLSRKYLGVRLCIFPDDIQFDFGPRTYLVNV